jgi:hypothetical protein
MTTDYSEPQAQAPRSPALRLEIAGQSANTPWLIPVLIRNLSTQGVTLTVTNPWRIPDWDRYRGANCVLRVEDPGGGDPVTINAKISWTRFGGTGQPPLSLGLQLIKPPVESIRQLSNLLPHTSQDIKGLWERYDQVRTSPEKRDWLRYCYFGGLGLLVGGLALQFATGPGYKVCGWVLWMLGSLGIAGKIILPFWHKQPSRGRIGRSL